MDKSLPVPRTGLSTVTASLRARAASLAAGDVGLMFFLLRMAFWLGLVLILLPTGASQQTPAANDVGAADAISAASATVSDLRGFCTRQPDACSFGSHFAVAMGYKAQAGAKMLYEFLTQAMASRAVTPHETGSIADVRLPAKPVLDKAAAESSQNTLTPADLTPAWRGPSPRKDAKHAA
jgi:hypothetical protein